MTRTFSRTCIGCRQIGSAVGMVRLVVRDGGVLIASRHGGRAMPRQGRGAWLHPKIECVSAAPRAAARAFRGAVTMAEPTQFLAEMRAAIGMTFNAQGDSP
jgi:predicted RNA-binding protein YlxR (DUF448 family)